MKTHLVRAGTAAAALLLAAANMTAASQGTAAAQSTVQTEKYMIGTGSVTGATVAAQPNAAGDTANYTVGFTAPGALVGGRDTITISDPTSSVTFPSAKSNYLVIDNNNSAEDQPPASLSLGTNGHSVTLGLSTSLPAGTSVSVYVTGATNPATAGTYNLEVSTSANPAPASTAGFVIAPTSPSFAPTASPAIVGGASTYTIGAFKAASAMVAGDELTISSSAGTGTDDNIAFPTTASAYKVTDLTTGTSSTPSEVSVSPAASGRTGQGVTLKLSGPIASGDEISVTVGGVRNPSSTQSDTVSAAAPAGGTAVTAQLQLGTSVADPSVSLSNATAGAGGVEYVVGFRAFSALAAGATVTLEAPAGTGFAGAKVTVVDATHTGASASLAASSVKTAAAGGSGTQNSITLSLPNAIAAGDQVFVEVEGLTNPAAGTYGGANGNFTVATSSDVVPAVVAAYSVVASPAPLLASIEVSPSAPGAAAQYSIGDLKLTAGMVGGSSTLAVAAPAGTVLPASANDYTIADLTDPARTAHPSGLSGGGTSSVTLMAAANLSAGDFIELVLDDVTNPPAGTYDMSVVGDVSAAVPPAPVVTPTAPKVVQTTTSLSLSANPAVVGEPVAYAAKVSPAPSSGTVEFLTDGRPVAGCSAVPVHMGTASCTTTYWAAARSSVTARFSGATGFGHSTSGALTQVINLPPLGYWVAARSGEVFGAGGAKAMGGINVSAATGPVVGIASTPSGKGYWVVTSHGVVAAFGDARSFGDLPGERVTTKDIVAIAPTSDGRGYWLVGRDGGLFSFGDARYHGSVPGMGLHVKDVAGMVASRNGQGYLLVGGDGGVFTFGTTHFYGSLPGLGKHVHDIRAILPASSGHGYVLVGADGGAFVFGTGVVFKGSLPGRHTYVNDIVGIALTPDDGGYYMAGANGSIYGFGDATVWSMPAALRDSLPVAAIAGT